MTYTKFDFLPNHIIKDRYINVCTAEALNSLAYGVDNLSLPIGSIRMFNLPRVDFDWLQAWPDGSFYNRGASAIHAGTRFASAGGATSPARNYQVGDHSLAVDEPIGPALQWNRFTSSTSEVVETTDAIGVVPGTWMRMLTVDGMLKITALVSISFPTQLYTKETTIVFGRTDWFEVGLFVNNNLVASSGRMSPRHTTVRLPVSIPIGSRRTTIDIRYRYYASDVLEQVDDALEVNRSPISLWTSSIYARNQFR